MITKHDLGLYKELFKKANTLLGYDENSDKQINSIDEYFLNLGSIKDKLQEQNLNDISYFMLPMDEPLFEINANTRTITIPDAFKTGISVQGDEVAETIFFSIDRYYDTTDFYDDYIIPVIQWKYADETGVGAYHLSAATGKIVMVDENSKTGGTIKVVFGWPISSEVTSRAANIQFSVRFYTIVDENGNLIEEWEKYSDGELEYSFSTLNAVTKINPSLNVKMNEGAFSYDNKNHLIWKRMRNSKPADLNLQAINPIIEYFIPAAGTFADLDETGYLTLKVKPIYPSGTVDSRIGKQIYEIWRIDQNNNQELYATGTASSFHDIINDGEDGFDIDYVPVLKSEKERNTTDIYFKKIVSEEDGSITYELYKDPELIDGLYKRVQTYKIDTAGKYYVNIINFINDTNKGSNLTKPFEIALPTNPIVGESKDDKYNNYILRFVVDDDGIETPEVVPVILTLSTVDTDEGSTLTYNWYRSENENGENKVLLTEVPQENVAFSVNQPGYYYLEAINYRNNAEAKVLSKNGIRVTYPATTPYQIKYLINNYPMSEQQLNDKVINHTTVLKLNPEAERAEINNGFRYEWYKEGSSAVIGTKQELSFMNENISDIVYCKVYSIYNGDESAPFETVHFTII